MLKDDWMNGERVNAAEWMNVEGIERIEVKTGSGEFCSSDDCGASHQFFSNVVQRRSNGSAVAAKHAGVETM